MRPRNGRPRAQARACWTSSVRIRLLGAAIRRQRHRLCSCGHHAAALRRPWPRRVFADRERPQLSAAKPPVPVAAQRGRHTCCTAPAPDPAIAYTTLWMSGNTGRARFMYIEQRRAGRSSHSIIRTTSELLMRCCVGTLEPPTSAGPRAFSAGPWPQPERHARTHGHGHSHARLRHWSARRRRQPVRPWLRASGMLACRQGLRTLCQCTRVRASMHVNPCTCIVAHASAKKPAERCRCLQMHHQPRRFTVDLPSVCAVSLRCAVFARLATAGHSARGECTPDRTAGSARPAGSARRERWSEATSCREPARIGQPRAGRAASAGARPQPQNRPLATRVASVMVSRDTPRPWPWTAANCLCGPVDASERTRGPSAAA